MDLVTYPFIMLKKKISLILLPALVICFLLSASVYFSNEDIFSVTERFFGGEISLSATNISKYDEIGADGIIPIMRFGGITKGITTSQVVEFFSNPFSNIIVLLVFVSLFLQYLVFAVVSRAVFNFKNKYNSSCFKGLTFSSIALAFIASVVVFFISSFSLQGFQLVLLLNFAVIFALAIPNAAAGDSIGEALFNAFDFLRFNLRGVIRVYLLSMGVALAVPIGLLLVFTFPLSVLSPIIVPYFNILLTILGISFALVYQFIICSREVYDFHRKVETMAHAYHTRLAKRVK